MSATKCANRMHGWDIVPPKPGAKCTECGKGYRVYRLRQPKPEAAFELYKFPPPSSPARPGGEPGRLAPVIDLTRLQQRWKPAPSSEPVVAEKAVPVPEPSKEEKSTVSLGTLAQWLGEPLTEFLIELARKRVEKKGFVPNLPDPDWQEKLQECVDKLLREKLPSVEMTPLTGAVVSLILIYVSMRWNAKPLDQAEREELTQLRKEKAAKTEIIKPAETTKAEEPTQSKTNLAPVATSNSVGGTEDLNQYPSIYDSLPTDNSWLMGDGGTVKNAVAFASAA